MRWRWLLLALLLPLPLFAQDEDEEDDGIEIGDGKGGEVLDPRKLFDEGKALFVRGEFTRARERFERALKGYEQEDREERRVHHWSYIGLCQLSDGRFAEALEAQRAALKGFRELYGDQEHPDVAATLSNVAQCLQRLQRSKEALALYEQSLAMHRRVARGPDASMAMCLSNLGLFLSRLGRHEDAIRHLEEHLALRKRLHDGEHPEVAQAHLTLAGGFESLGQFEQALLHVQVAVAMLRRLGSGARHILARGLIDWGFCLRLLGRDTESIPRLEEAVVLCRRLGPPLRPELERALVCLGHCHQHLRRDAQAIIFLEEAVELCGRRGEAAHARASLATCLSDAGRHAEAKKHFDLTLAWCRRDKAGQSLIPSCLQGLGDIHMAHDRFEAALRCFREALVVLEQLSATGTPYSKNNAMAAILVRLSGSLAVLDRAEEGLEVARRALRVVRLETHP